MTDEQMRTAKALVMLRRTGYHVSYNAHGELHQVNSDHTGELLSATDTLEGALATAYDAMWDEPPTLEEAAASLGIQSTPPPGFRLIAEADLEHIQNLADEAAGGRQYDPSWIRPKTLSMQERIDRMKQVALQLAALSQDTQKGAPSPDDHFIIIGHYTQKPIGCCSRDGIPDVKEEEPLASIEPWPRETCPICHPELKGALSQDSEAK